MEKFLRVSLLLLALNIAATSALQCLSCDSATEPGCGYSHNDTVSVTVIECAETVGQCFIATIDEDTYRVVRGCNDLLGSTICGQFGCELCPTDQCNDMQVIQESCISCVSDPENTFCEWNVIANNEPVICPDTTEERSGCFLQVKDNVYTRDCVANLDDEEFENCRSGDGDCKICKGNDCNRKEEFQRCYHCDSELDENCVDRPDGSYIKTCENYHDSCVYFAVANGKTGRGCSSEIETEPTFCPGTNCVECTGVECNSALVPSYRISCYQCDDSQFGCTYDQEMFKSFQRACNIFNFQDQCYTYEDEDSFYRGCMSDDSEQSQFCAANPENCTICSESSCNSLPLIKAPTISCYKCSGDECLQENGPTVGQCEAEVFPGNQETCYYTTLVGGAVQMGCTLDDSAVCTSNNCLTCTGDNCNSEYAPKKSELLCHQCLDTDESCPWRQKELDVPVYCQSMVLFGEVDSCYHYTYSTGEARRGCLKDDRFFCYGHDCKTCTGNYCNSVAETQSCIQCISTQEGYETCGEDAANLNAVQCSQPAFFEEIGCFSVKNDEGVVTRGCWNEATEEHKSICSSGDADRCVKCVGEGCNTNDHGGSATLFVSFTLVLLSALVATLMGQ